MASYEWPEDEQPVVTQVSKRIVNPEVNASIDNLKTTSSLEGLQTDEQRQVLDTVAQIRKCGLESILSLPQLVVCGDQSAGKSSVLEALTEIPFPRNDNLCTRFATEIILRRATIKSLTIKVIPDTERSNREQETINAFNETIIDLEQLPEIMEKAMVLMGIDSASNTLSNGRAFARDVLSIEIEGPSRPQLTLVDLPGLIQNETKGVTQMDVDLVTELTNHYIAQPRTICLAVVSATNDYANQGILNKVRKVDPDGERTLGIITKPDRLPSGSGSELAFINLAQNEDVFFKLGWHVLKNRSFEEGSSSFAERNFSEANYFRTSNFKSLPKENVGIDALRARLSKLLFNHIKQELPKLRQDLDLALNDARSQLTIMGNRRVTSQECRAYLTQLSLDIYEVCKAAVDGHYEGDYFNRNTDEPFSLSSQSTIRRLRACVQAMNSKFSEHFHSNGHKYWITRAKNGEITIDDELLFPREACNTDSDVTEDSALPKPTPGTPIKLSYSQSLNWVNQVLIRTRGRELPGNFNPLLVGELFWDQSSSWHNFAVDHMEDVWKVCCRFLNALLEEKCPRDVFSRLWPSQIQDVLKSRKEAAEEELSRIMEDIKGYPINYNHYYTDTIKKQRQDRRREALQSEAQEVTTTQNASDLRQPFEIVKLVRAKFMEMIDPDMGKHSCEEALDCLSAIYKVSEKTFIANITTQVIERHIVRGLEKIFSPVAVNSLPDTDIASFASEPESAKRQRDFLEDRIKKLSGGHQVLRQVIGSNIS